MTPQLAAHTPTLGESLDHYGEAYCMRAVNEYQSLLDLKATLLKMLGKANRKINAPGGLVEALEDARATLTRWQEIELWDKRDSLTFQKVEKALRKAQEVKP